MKPVFTVAAVAALTIVYPLAGLTAGTGTSGAGGSMGTTPGSAGMTGSSSTSGSMDTPGSAGMSGAGTGSSGTSSSIGLTAAGNANINGDTSWNSQNTYWRNTYSSRPYYSSSRDYSLYEPAYRYGVDLYNRNMCKPYESLSANQLNSGWGQARGTSSLNWNDAQVATRDAYNRMYQNCSSAAGGTTGRTAANR
jgi:hypothetical protein